MALKVLIVPDKFKGSLKAAEAARAMAKGWKRARPDDMIESLPMSDGGDGFGEVMGNLLEAKVQKARVLDAAHRRTIARWWWESRTRMAIIESAEVIGLAMLPAGMFRPLTLDTFGLGQIIREVSNRGSKRCLVGIGGSATNDGGFGMARALGWQFMDAKGSVIENWTGLAKLKQVQPPRKKRLFNEVRVAVDVQNPLLGTSGATRVYGPQKGLRKKDFALTEGCLARLAEVIEQQFGSELANMPGAGAAGGLGFGLAAFLGARLQPGFQLFAGEAGLNLKLRSADLIITGEGALDESSLMGKGVGELANSCKRLGIPCLGIAGQVRSRKGLERVFSQVWAMTQVTTATQGKARPEFWLERLTEKVAKSFPRT